MTAALRSERWTACAVCAGLLLGVVLLTVTVLTGSNRTAPASNAATHQTVLSLRTQSLLSAKVGSTDPGFAARRSGSGYALTGGGVSATLGRSGARIAGRGSVSMALAAVGRANRLDPVGKTGVSARGNRVTYGYRGLTAWYSAGPLGIEQGFTVARRPAGRGSSLTLALSLAGSLTATRTGSGIRFLTRSGELSLSYDGLAAVDASGRRLPVSLELAHGRLLVRVHDQGARYPVRIDPLFQLAPKLTGGSEVGPGDAGWAVALSGDGSTAVIGGPYDNGGAGAAWVFVHAGSTWTQQAKLVPNNESGSALFGYSIALSSDGDVALISGDGDNSEAGAAWVYTRSGSTWTQQAKLTGAGESGAGAFGQAVALSSDGTIALVGGYLDSGGAGAAWVFTGSGSTWNQEKELTPSNPTGTASWFGAGVALSADGTTALIGGEDDNSDAGAAWVFTGSGSSWTQQAKLTSSDAGSLFGDSVALSADGNTALIGGFGDSNYTGAAWVFTNSGTGWDQLGSKLVGNQESGYGRFGVRVALSADGDSALIGGYTDNNGVGAAWLFTLSGSTWMQGGKMTPLDESGDGQFGFGVSLSADGGTAIIGADLDNDDVGAAWIFGNAPPTCANTGATTAVGGGTVTLALQCAGPIGVPLSYGIVSGPSHGTLGAINQATGAVSYTPDRGYTGADQFTYDATGADGGSNVATAAIAIPAAPPRTVRLNPTIGYTLHATRRYTVFDALYLTGVPSAARVDISCRGRGCPSKSRTERVPDRRVCKGKGKHRRCVKKPAPRVGTVTLTSLFRHRHLAVGVKVTIRVVQSGAIGRVYVLRIRRSRAPSDKVSCLAPGSTTPGRGC